MTTQAPRPAAVLVAILFALSCFLLTVFVWTQFGGPIPLRPQGYRFHAPFAQGSQLTPNADVRISGVNIGKVVTIRPRGGRTDAVIELQRKYAPIPSDARAILRSKTLLGETFVELTPGSPNAPKLHEDATLAISQIEPTQQLDQVLSAFDAPTRASFKRFLSDFSTALAGRGQDINAAIGSAAPAITNLSEVVAVLDRQQPAVQGLIRDSGVALRALGNRASDLQTVITAGNEVFAATAARNRELTATVQALPTFLRELRATLASAEVTGRDAAPVLRALRPVAPLLPPALREVDVLAPQAQAVFRELDPVITLSEKALPAATRVINAANAQADVLYPAARDLVPTIDIIKTYQHDIIAAFANIGATFQAKDAAGNHYLRSLIPLTNEGPLGFSQRLPTNRHNPYFAPGKLSDLSPGPLRAYDCNNLGNPASLAILGSGQAPPCLLAPPWTFQGHTRKFPHVERAH